MPASNPGQTYKGVSTSVAEVIIGGSGDDTLTGDSGVDTLDGGGGNDTLQGGTGNDVYVVRQGSGFDTITDSGGSSDRIRIEGLALNDVRFERRKANLNDLVIIYGKKIVKDELTVKNWFSASANVVEQMEFDDGTIWNAAIVKQLVITTGTVGADAITADASYPSKIYGYEGADTLNGSASADFIDGGDGTDSIPGGDGDDILLGGDGDDGIDGNGGNDTLLGGDGEDWLTGNAGNDWFEGGPGDDALGYGLFGDDGAGNDTYVFREGDGVDGISEYDTTSGNRDTAIFEMDSSRAWSVERRINTYPYSSDADTEDLILRYGVGEDQRDALVVTSYFEGDVRRLF